MYSKLFVLFLLLVHKSNGQPLEVSKPAYDVNTFLSTRIVGGEVAPRGHAKHMVALIWHMVGFSPFLICGGSIVSPKHVLTAAHCIDAYIVNGELMQSFKGTIGSQYWDAGHIIEFSEFDIHQDWDWDTIKNDIGILVSEDIRINEHTAIIPLDFKWKQGPAVGTVYGWGKMGVWEPISDIVLVLNVTIITPQECQRRLDEANLVLGQGPPFDPTVEICTMHSFGHGMCNGDSGSALIDTESGKVVGIVSWGWQCARGFPDFFARVSGFYYFLDRHLREYYDHSTGELYVH